MIEYKVELDILRTGLFDHELSDITNRVRDRLSFTTGYQQGQALVNNASALVSPSNILQLTLDNRDGAFNYEATGTNGIIGAAFYNLLAQSIMLRFSMTHDGITHSYTFYTVGIRTSIGRYGDQVATITARDAVHRLQAIKYEPEVKTNVRTSDAIIDFFKDADIFLPYSSDFFILDVSKINPDVGVFSIINPADTINRKLYDGDTSVNDFVEVETGISILDYVGDALRDIPEDHQLRNNGLAFVYDVCMGEAFGRLYFNPRDNKFHFQNRHHDANATSKLLLTTSDIVGLDMSQGIVANDVRVMFIPRELGTAGSIIFSAVGQDMVTISPGNSVTVGVQFRDPDNETDPISAINVIEPVAGTDVIVLNQADQVVTGSVYIGADLNATGGEIQFRNRLNETVRVTKLQVRGRPVYMRDQQYARASDGESIFFHNHIPLQNIVINYCFDQNFAQSVADYMVREYAPTRRVAESVTIVLREDNYLDIMSLDLGDAITIYDPDSNHTGDYIIMGESHDFDISAGMHRITFILRSKDITAYFVLDRNTLDDQQIVLGY